MSRRIFVAAAKNGIETLVFFIGRPPDGFEGHDGEVALGHGHVHDHVHDHVHGYDHVLHPAGVGFVAPRARLYAGLSLDPAHSRNQGSLAAMARNAV
jgi:hypothetical protein